MEHSSDNIVLEVRHPRSSLRQNEVVQTPSHRRSAFAFDDAERTDSPEHSPFERISQRASAGSRSSSYDKIEMLLREEDGSGSGLEMASEIDEWVRSEESPWLPFLEGEGMISCRDPSINFDSSTLCSTDSIFGFLRKRATQYVILSIALFYFFVFASACSIIFEQKVVLGTVFKFEVIEPQHRDLMAGIAAIGPLTYECEVGDSIQHFSKDSITLQFAEQVSVRGWFIETNSSDSAIVDASFRVLWSAGHGRPFHTFSERNFPAGFECLFARSSTWTVPLAGKQRIEIHTQPSMACAIISAIIFFILGVGCGLTSILAFLERRVAARVVVGVSAGMLTGLSWLFIFAQSQRDGAGPVPLPLWRYAITSSLMAPHLICNIWRKQLFSKVILGTCLHLALLCMAMADELTLGKTYGLVLALRIHELCVCLCCLVLGISQIVRRNRDYLQVFESVQEAQGRLDQVWVNMLCVLGDGARNALSDLKSVADSSKCCKGTARKLVQRMAYAQDPLAPQQDGSSARLNVWDNIMTLGRTVAPAANFDDRRAGPVVHRLDQLYAQGRFCRVLLQERAKQLALECRGMFPLGRMKQSKYEESAPYVLWQEAKYDEEICNSIQWTQLKPQDKAESKVLAHYGGEVCRIMDICRETIVFEEVADITRCLLAVVKDKQVVVERIKNTLTMEPCSEQEQGFRGVLLNLRIDSPAARALGVSGFICELQLVPLAVACCLSQDDALGFQKLRRAGDARDCLTFNHSFRLFRWLQSRSSERGHARTWQLPAPLAWQANGTNGGGARRSMDSNMRRTMDSNMGSERDLRMPRAMSLLPDRTRMFANNQLASPHNGPDQYLDTIIPLGITATESAPSTMGESRAVSGAPGSPKRRNVLQRRTSSMRNPMPSLSLSAETAGEAGEDERGGGGEEVEMGSLRGYEESMVMRKSVSEGVNIYRGKIMIDEVRVNVPSDTEDHWHAANSTGTARLSSSSSRPSRSRSRPPTPLTLALPGLPARSRHSFDGFSQITAAGAAPEAASASGARAGPRPSRRMSTEAEALGCSTRMAASVPSLSGCQSAGDPRVRVEGMRVSRVLSAGEAEGHESPLSPPARDTATQDTRGTAIKDTADGVLACRIESGSPAVSQALTAGSGVGGRMLRRDSSMTLEVGADLENNTRPSSMSARPSRMKEWKSYFQAKAKPLVTRFSVRRPRAEARPEPDRAVDWGRGTGVWYMTLEKLFREKVHGLRQDFERNDTIAAAVMDTDYLNVFQTSYPIQAALCKSWFRIMSLLLWITYIVAGSLAFARMGGAGIVEAQWVMFVSEQQRGTQLRPSPVAAVGTMGVRRQDCKNLQALVAEESEEANKWVLRLDKDARIAGFFWRTSLEPADRDPVQFKILVSTDGTKWSVAATSHRTLQVGGFEQWGSGVFETPTARGALVDVDFRPPWFLWLDPVASRLLQAATWLGLYICALAHKYRIGERGLEAKGGMDQWLEAGRGLLMAGLVSNALCTMVGIGALLQDGYTQFMVEHICRALSAFVLAACACVFPSKLVETLLSYACARIILLFTGSKQGQETLHSLELALPYLVQIVFTLYVVVQHARFKHMSQHQVEEDIAGYEQAWDAVMNDPNETLGIQLLGEIEVKLMQSFPLPASSRVHQRFRPLHSSTSRQEDRRRRHNKARKRMQMQSSSSRFMSNMLSFGRSSKGSATSSFRASILAHFSKSRTSTHESRTDSGSSRPPTPFAFPSLPARNSVNASPADPSPPFAQRDSVKPTSSDGSIESRPTVTTKRRSLLPHALLHAESDTVSAQPTPAMGRSPSTLEQIDVEIRVTADCDHLESFVEAAGAAVPASPGPDLAARTSQAGLTWLRPRRISERLDRRTVKSSIAAAFLRRTSSETPAQSPLSPTSRTRGGASHGFSFSEGLDDSQSRASVKLDTSGQFSPGGLKKLRRKSFSSSAETKQLSHAMPSRHTPMGMLSQVANNISNRLASASHQILRSNHLAHAEGKPVESLDQLYAQAEVLQPLLKKKVQRWAAQSEGGFPLRQPAGKVAEWQFLVDRHGSEDKAAQHVKWAAVKDLSRAKEKLVRSYEGRPSRLLDICRQSIVFSSAHMLAECLALIAEDPDVLVVSIKNRLRDQYPARARSLGYRDVNLSLRFDSAKTRELGVDLHVCEVQLLLEPFAKLKSADGHKRYIAWRNCLAT